MRRKVAIGVVTAAATAVTLWMACPRRQPVLPVTRACRDPLALRDALHFFTRYYDDALVTPQRGGNEPVLGTKEEERVFALAGAEGSAAYCSCMREIISSGNRVAPDAARLSLGWMTACWSVEDQGAVIDLLATTEDAGEMLAAFSAIAEWGKSPKKRAEFALHDELARLFEAETSKRFANTMLARTALHALGMILPNSSTGIGLSPRALEVSRKFCARLPDKEWAGPYCYPVALELEEAVP